MYYNYLLFSYYICAPLMEICAEGYNRQNVRHPKVMQQNIFNGCPLTMLLRYQIMVLDPELWT